MDGSAPDSQFWSEGFGGTTPASELGVDKILFPNTANPYPYSIFTMERRFHQFALERLRGYGLDANNARAKYEYELRTTIVGSSDLLPLGGAFAKRCESMWDGNGPADAWEMTGESHFLQISKKILDFTSVYETYLRENTDRKIWLVNTNKLVRFKKGVDGLKTGYTKTAGYCLTATMKKNNMRVIATVMGEDSIESRYFITLSKVKHKRNLW